MTHQAIQALKEAVDDVSESAVDLTLLDLEELSEQQVRLGEIGLQIADTELVRRELER